MMGRNVELWERAAEAAPRDRSLVFVAGLTGDASPQQAAFWPVGERDAAILAAHQAWFGDRLDLQANCPGCGQTASFEVAIEPLLALHAQQAGTAWPLRIQLGEIVCLCRRPHTADLAAACAGSADLSEARRRLVHACVQSYDCDNRPCDIEDDAATFEALAAAFALADPLADMRFGMICPDCAQSWNAPFDPPSVFWRALECWAHAELDDVRRLARFYGWSERDIMAMSAARRNIYLDGVQ